jgi:N-acetylglucosaminyldiphosphoundecaprenol N-acetyl-beta-D-mannosaminyltransferase
MSIVEILGVKVNNISHEDALKEVGAFLRGQEIKRISTINPELILEAQKNKKFLDVLNRSHLNVADGAGLNVAFWKNKRMLKSRITGADLIWDVLEMAEQKKLKVFLVANKDGMSCWRRVRRKIRKKHPFLKINGMNLSPRARFSSIKNNEKLMNSHVLFCNFGAPHQEFFIDSVSREGNIRLAMGVGGSFDFISGKIKRAPKWVRKIGLEWLWRLFRQPWRIKRIFRATVIFPVRIMLSK